MIIHRLSTTAGRWSGLGIMLAVLVYAALPLYLREHLDIPCLFTALFGITCPGCGMKTAIIDLLAGRWQHATTTNLLSPAVVACIFAAAVRDVRRNWGIRGTIGGGI